MALDLELDDRHVAVWREQVCDQAIGADAPWTSGDRLAPRLGLAEVGSVVSLEIEVRDGGPTVERTSRRLACEQRPPAFGLSAVVSGAAEVDLGSRRIELAAGDLCLLDSTHPFRKRMGAGYRELFLYVPYELARQARGCAMPSLAPRIAPRGSALARLLGETVASVRRHAGALGGDELVPAIGAVLGLTNAVFGGRPVAADEAAAGHAVAWRARVLRHIDAYLDDPALAPAAIARELRISPRFLHRVFEDSGSSVGATILARRLERCRAMLVDPAYRHRSISEIAFALGFNSAPHFSRAFRARFGVSARALRAGLH
jgi:AraC-like DNA-binding protein